MSMRIVVVMVAALLGISTAAYAMFGQALLITRGQPSVVPIGIIFSPSAPNVSDASGSGVTIATIAVTMSSDSFSGSLSLPNNAGGIAALSGSNLVTARTLTSGDDGSYAPQVCATQNSVQICQVITVTVQGGIACDLGVPYTGSIPAEASNAGFTHCVLNVDFSNSFFSNFSNWLGNCGASTAQAIWANVSYFGGADPCSNYSVEFDSVAGTNVLHMIHRSVDNQAGREAVLMGTGGPDWGAPFSFPNGLYVEWVARSTSQTQTAIASIWPRVSIFEFANQPYPSRFYEWDLFENYADAGSAGAIHDWGNGGQGVAGATYFPGGGGLNEWNARYVNSYTSWAQRVTVSSDGLQTGVCWYRNGVRVLDPCQSQSPPSSLNPQRNNWVTGVGIQNDQNFSSFSSNMDVLIKRITFWGCANWQNTHCPSAINP